MKIKRWISFVFITITLVISPILTIKSDVSAQEPVNIYFPLFRHEAGPYYAFGLDGGTVEGLVIDPTDSNILYANSWGAGVYKSTNGGESWTNVSEGFDTAYIYELAIDTSNHDHILASDYEHGIKQTFDGGLTWNPVNGLPSWCVVYSIDFNPTSPNIVYVALREPTYDDAGHYVYPGGVFKSTDGGSTWVRKSKGLPNDYVYDLGIDPNNPQIIYTAMHRSGVYKTTNGGESWVAKNETMIDGDVRSVQVTPDSSRVYIGFWDGYGVSYTSNGGNSWTSVSSTNTANLFVYEVQVDPHHPTTIFLTTSTGIYKCENPSAASTCQVIAHQDEFIFDLTLDVNGPVNESGYTEVMYAGLQHFAIHKSVDAGTSFSPRYKGIQANIINVILVDPNDPNIQYVSSEGRGLFKTENNGSTWIPLHNALSSEFLNDLVFRPLDNNVLYAGTQYDGVRISLDGGQNWFSGNDGLSQTLVSDLASATGDQPSKTDPEGVYSWMDPVDLENMLAAKQSNYSDRSTSNTIVTAIGFHQNPAQYQYMFIGTNNSGVFLSHNYGYSWDPSGLTHGIVTDLIVNPQSTSYKYFISLEGSGVKASTDMYTWNNMNVGLPGNVYSLAYIPGTTIYLAGTDNGIYRFSNTETTWTSKGMGGLKVTDILVDPNKPDRIWATTNNGLYCSTDSGSTWSIYPLPDLINKNLLTIVSVPGTTEFLIGTNGGDYDRFFP